MRLFSLCSLALGLLVAQFSKSQVVPNINSGNPAFPYPQFLDYGPDRKTLASVNAPGVTHAEMEKRTRETWQLVCNNTSAYPNTVVGGVQYLYPTGPNNCTCAEGDGYYLLGAALMGDKSYFDGYYMWAHDRGFQGVKRFVDGQYNTPNYAYNKGLSGAGSFGAGTGVLGGGINGNSAADGDVDMGLALLMAYKQWGERSGIMLSNGDWGGRELNYKEEALRYIKAMVDTAVFSPALPERRYSTGIIGLDGYMKNGDTWGELTNWALPGYKGIQPTMGSNGNYYFDYSSPAWFRSFRSVLEQENASSFLINQYKRGEASADWLMGLHYAKDPKNIPYVGQVESLAGDDFKFSSFNPMGQDFRASWRTIMNYVWHGNPTYTWDPVTHETVNAANTFEYDMGIRYSKFLKNNQDVPWSNPCRNVGDLKSKLTFKGPYTLVESYTPDGKALGNFPLNWIHGASAGSAIAGQDFELMGDMFRQCVIAWDAAIGQNLDSKPRYFHEWFRLLGMLTLSGNFHSPMNMVAAPNLKVYHKVDKTVAHPGQHVTFTVSYRNYGSVDALGTLVKFGIPSGFEFVNSSKGATLSGDSILWNVGTAKGFKTGALSATQDSMKVRLRVKQNVNNRYCTSARIFCSNGLGWVSNEYPNNVTAVMERNCVDVIENPLFIEKSSNVSTINPSLNTSITYKIKFGARSETGRLNGGRPGVRLAFAHGAIPMPSNTSAMELQYRIFHDAAEPYIDYGNYRLSYFLNDPTCYNGVPGCPGGWQFSNTIAEGVDPLKVNVAVDPITPGTSASGSWNQRLTLQFSPQLATITQHLQQYAGAPQQIHEGGNQILRTVWRMTPSNFSPVDWSDDWSWDASLADSNDGLYYPIGDDYTDPKALGTPVTSWHKSACQTTTQIVKNVLVEEWDGYTWRRIYGNGPSASRVATNIIVRDTLPEGLQFGAFGKAEAFGFSAIASQIANGRTVLQWSIPTLSPVSEIDSIMYSATINGTCPSADREIKGQAWISAENVSPISSSSSFLSSCLLTSLTGEEMSPNEVRIFPNPAKDLLMVQVGRGQTEISLSIKDVKGNQVYQYKGEATNGLDISQLANGVYLVEVSVQGRLSRSKLVVLK